MRFAPASLLILLLAASCGDGIIAVETHRYVPINTPGGRMCAVQCQEAHDYCTQTCTIGQRSCMSQMQSQALVDYQKYVREQWMSHDPVELRLRDFERPERCSTKPCEKTCEQRHQLCYEGCGGTVEATTSCRVLCF